MANVNKRGKNKHRFAKKSNNPFKEAINATPDVNGCWKPGLSALSDYSKKVIIPKEVSVNGSLDIDGSTALLYPSDNRWDYAVCCAGKVYYIEVHSAITSEVFTVIKKLRWLKSWLALNAPEIVKLTDYSVSPFYWVQSSNCQIPHHMPQYKMAVDNKLKPIKEWNYAEIVKSK